MDTNEIIKTSNIISRPVLRFGDGVEGGEIIDSKSFVEGGVEYILMVIKISSELIKWHRQDLREEDIRQGYTSWYEMKDLMIEQRRSPTSPILLALRSFDHKDTPLSLMHLDLLGTIKNLSENDKQKDKMIQSLQEDLRKWAEGAWYFKIEEIIRKVNAEFLTQIMTVREMKK